MQGITDEPLVALPVGLAAKPPMISPPNAAASADCSPSVNRIVDVPISNHEGPNDTTVPAKETADPPEVRV